MTRTFEEFGFDERIQKGIDEAGFKTPMAVQAECFQLLIKDRRDIYAQSQTGTGKTAAFLLGIFQLMLTDEKYKGQKALVVVPTRELAVQIEREGKLLGKYLDLKVGCVYGGVGYGAQEKMLENGVDVLVGTPGRLIDFGKQRKFSFGDFAFLVIDEADRLFDMGFLPDLRRILKGMRPQNERLTMLFSATLNPRVGNLAWEYMNDPGEVIIDPEKVTVDTVTQVLYHVGKDEKMKLLLGILKRDDPRNAVIFTNTRHSAWEVAKRMEVNGYAVVSLMGDLPQSKRSRIVDEVKNGDHKYLVATDVAARGLHIDELEMVINFDVPLEAESYVHRIGRTARAGREGKTITMACEEYVYGLGPIEKLLDRKIPVSWADESMMVEDKSTGMRFPPRDRYRELAGGGDDRRPDRGAAGGRRTERPDRDRGRDVAGRQRAPKDLKKPLGGKVPLDPRAVKIQSAISSIAGGSIEEFNAETENIQEHRRADERSDRSKSGAARPERSTGGGGKNKKAGFKKQSDDVRRSVPAPPQEGEPERLRSDSSIDERLAYYRKKYGEDFQLNGSAGSSGGKAKKRRKPGPARNDSSVANGKKHQNVSAGRDSGKASDGPSAGRTPAVRKPGDRKPGDRNPVHGKSPSEGRPQVGNTEKKPEEKKKGLLGRLFGR
jgi:ATP-dependent RNA helicase RhlB